MDLACTTDPLADGHLGTDAVQPMKNPEPDTRLNALGRYITGQTRPYYMHFNPSQRDKIA